LATTPPQSTRYTYNKASGAVALNAKY